MMTHFRNLPLDSSKHGQPLSGDFWLLLPIAARIAITPHKGQWQTHERGF